MQDEVVEYDRGVEDADSLHPAFVPASPSRRGTAALIDVVLAVVAAFITGVGGFLGLMAVRNTDFDGPPQYDALANWYFLTFVTSGVILYGLPEVFGWRTLGKCTLGLRLVAASDGPHVRLRCFRRWSFKASPALLLLAISTAGVVHTELLGWEGFDDFGWTMGSDVVISFAFPCLLVLAAFLSCLEDKWFRATYDVLYGVVVVQVAADVSQMRGFPVVATSTRGKLVS